MYSVHYELPWRPSRCTLYIMPYPSKLSLDAIADAAVRIVEERGLSALGVRSVAESLAVRPTALYRYCSDYDGLVSLVSEYAAGLLRQRALRALEQTPTPSGADHALGVMAFAYRKFAEQHPALYGALVTDTTRSSWKAQGGAARKALWDLLLQVVGGVTGDPDDTGAAVAVWSFLHGFAHLREAGLFGASGPRDGFERGLAALMAGLRTGSPQQRRAAHPH